MVKDDYENNDNAKCLLSGRNLRDQVPVLKKEFQFLKTVYSTPLKNTAIRLHDAFEKRFRDKTGKVGFPNFRSWKRKWFSLYYDEPYVGYKIDGNDLTISFGKDEDSHQYKITVQQSERLKLKDNCQLKNMRITKEGKKFYAVFTINKEVMQRENDQVKRWISFDPNHKNMMVGVDYQGRSIEFSKLSLVKYWDDKIDLLKSKRDKLKKKTRFYPTFENRGYYKNSRKWERVDRALNKAYSARREQIKQALYTVSNLLAKHYDLVLIGDYVPSTETARYDNQHRPMLNQTFIGSLRKVVDWVMLKSGKEFRKVDEYHTTKECPFCGFMEHKEPSIRLYTCPECGTTYYRDLGSAINIARKEKLLLRSDYVGWFLEQPMYTVSWNYKLCKWQIVSCDTDKSKDCDWSLVLNCA
jgi:putative transposase